VIVCSCNFLSDIQVRSAVASGATRARVSCVYASLGCAVQCGRCVRTIKAFLSGSIDVGDGKSSTSCTDGAAR